MRPRPIPRGRPGQAGWAAGTEKARDRACGPAGHLADCLASDLGGGSTRRTVTFTTLSGIVKVYSFADESHHELNRWSI